MQGTATVFLQPVMAFLGVKKFLMVKHCQITDITFHAARCFNIWRSVRFTYNTLVVSFMSCSRSLNMGLMNLTPRNIYRNADMEIIMLTH